LGITSATCSKGCGKKGDLLEAQPLLQCMYVGFSLAFHLLAALVLDASLLYVT